MFEPLRSCAFCTSDTSSELFRFHKVLKTFVISKDPDRDIRIFEIGLLYLEAVDNGQEFFVIDLVVAFC